MRGGQGGVYQSGLAPFLWVRKVQADNVLGKAAILSLVGCVEDEVNEVKT